jgi:hypothetical protein
VSVKAPSPSRTSSSLDFHLTFLLFGNRDAFGEAPNATREARVLPRVNRLAREDRADKIHILWLNTELRGCRATALDTM